VVQSPTHAARILSDGGVVALPTETVYGLAANALDAAAVARVFRIKGRPRTHPLIVHLGDVSMIEQWAARVPDAAWQLAERFWPGPLTLILPKTAMVPVSVTGGQESVGLRVPNHPLALAVLREFGGGLAAPSANRFGAVSPTTAEHVRRDLGDEVDLILDGGPCVVGVESTIVSLMDADPIIRRPGGVTREAIEEVLGQSVQVHQTGSTRVPGQVDTHYAPRAAVRLLPAEELEAQAALLRSQGLHVRIFSQEDVAPTALFASLRRADDEGVDVILATPGHEAGLGLAVADRLRKAAAPRGR